MRTWEKRKLKAICAPGEIPRTSPQAQERNRHSLWSAWDTGISPLANICSLCAWQASLPIYERQMRTHAHGYSELTWAKAQMRAKCDWELKALCAPGEVPSTLHQKKEKHHPNWYPLRTGICCAGWYLIWFQGLRQAFGISPHDAIYHLAVMSRIITISNYGNFAKGEYLLALRLANKLADLRAANANPYPENRRFSGWVDPDGITPTQKGHPQGVSFLCWWAKVFQSRIREFHHRWIYPHPVPEERALRSSGGVCEPIFKTQSVLSGSIPTGSQ